MPYIVKDQTGTLTTIYAYDPGPDAGATYIEDSDPEVHNFNSGYSGVVEATGALKQSDDVVMRCYEAGIPLPDAWKTYRAALRAIVSGASTVTLPLTTPAVPTGI